MKKILILFFVFLIGISTFLIPVTAGGEVVWKLAHKMPPASPEGKAYQVFADEVAKLSKGKMKIEVYHSEQLGGVRVSMDMLRRGTLQMYLEGISYAHSFMPQFYVPTLPFVFRDRAHLNKFIETPMFNKWKEELIGKTGIRILGYGEFVRGPYRTLVSKRPVLKLGDVEGLKLRMYKSEMVMKVWKELGANITYLAWTEVYDGLKRGLIEAVTAPVGLVESMNFQEVAKYLLRTNEFPQSIAFYVNDKGYQDLPADLQNVLLAAYKESCGYSQRTMAKAAEESLSRMIQRDKLMVIRAPMDAFREKVEPVYEKWESEGKYGLTKGMTDYIKGL
jgi:tripartite ATP-independent transporter DctP family solute receptor